MRGVYRVLAGLVALGVVVQASSMVYAVAGLGKYVDDGGTFDKASGEAMMEGDITFAGAGGFAVHGLNGMMIIPVLALLLLIVSFFAKVPGGILWAGLILLDVIVQVALGLFGHEVPAIGALHGINALILFGLAVSASMRARESRVTPATGAPTSTGATTAV